MKLCLAIVSSFLFLGCLSGCGATRNTAAPPAPVLVPPLPPFPTLDRPLFAKECYYLVPDGENRRGVFLSVDDEGDPLIVRIMIKPESLAELMKELDPAFRTQEVDRSLVQLVCFPKKGEPHRPPAKNKTETLQSK